MSDVQEVAERRARPLITLLVLVGLLFLVTMWEMLGLLSGGRFDRGGFGGSLVLMLVVSLATLVLWIAWFKVLHERVVDARRARFTRSAWLWAWLIPGANVVVPKMLVNDVWRAGDAPGAPPSSPPWPVQAWWVVWVAFELLKPLTRFAGEVGPRLFLTGMAAIVVAEVAFSAITVWILTKRIGEVVPAMPPQAAPVLV